ncbi:hypothetical protein E2C01_048555 [Portunus trituberculatus]|uniref:Secreted protein n=1 Tax=Portunus trituberculatus TaxID=210409 RepID=A0A5B7G6R8_PORTR|nr:hypothetical protein [Portunus trituberculatus]
MDSRAVVSEWSHFFLLIFTFSPLPLPSNTPTLTHNREGDGEVSGGGSGEVHPATIESCIPFPNTLQDKAGRTRGQVKVGALSET